MLKFLTLATNFGVLVVFGFMLLDKGIPRGGEALTVGLIVVASAFGIASAVKAQSGARKAVGTLTELAGLEIEARKATLKRRIEDAEQG